MPSGRFVSPNVLMAQGVPLTVPRYTEPKDPAGRGEREEREREEREREERRERREGK